MNPETQGMEKKSTWKWDARNATASMENRVN